MIGPRTASGRVRCWFEFKASGVSSVLLRFWLGFRSGSFWVAFGICAGFRLLEADFSRQTSPRGNRTGFDRFESGTHPAVPLYRCERELIAREFVRIGDDRQNDSRSSHSSRPSLLNTSRVSPTTEGIERGATASVLNAVSSFESNWTVVVRHRPLPIAPRDGCSPRVIAVQPGVQLLQHPYTVTAAPRGV